MFVGEDFVAQEERHFDVSRASRLRHLYGGQSVDLLPAAVDGAAPILRLRIETAGGHLIVLDRNLTKIELPPERFEAYLRHEGLDAVAAERARRGEKEKPGREQYTRCLKALIQVGDVRDGSFGEVIGQALEIIPEQNPVFVAPGERLNLDLRFRGAPLAGAKIEAFSRDGADVRGAEYRTDERGVAAVAIDRPGVWLVRTVHMIRCEGCAGAEWESTWASYVFASSPAGGGTVTAPPMLAPSRRIWWAAAALIVAVMAAAVTVWLVRLRRARRAT